MKTFEQCVNTKHPDFVKLSNTYGYATAALLTRGNNMDVPSLTKAKELLLSERKKKFQSLLDYLDNSNVIDKTGITKQLSQFVHTFQNLTLVKHSEGLYQNNKFSKFTHDNNVRALKEIQRQLEENNYNLFQIQSNSTTIGSKLVYNQEELDKINAYKASVIDNKIEAANEPILAKLVAVEETPSYEKAKGNWQFSPNFNLDQQLNISNTLSGLTFQFISKALLDGKNVNIFSKDVVNEIPQLVTKKVYQKKLEDLNKKGELSLQETELKEKLQELLKDNVWNKFQEDVINKLAPLGFQINNKTGETVQIEPDLEEAPLQTSEEDEQDDTLSEGESFGKTAGFSDYAEYTISTKDKLSPRLKVWLSSIPSNEESFIPVTFPNLNVNTTYIPLDIVINAISEATVGKRTPQAIIEALEKASKDIPNRYFLSEVVKRLKQEQSLDTRTPNEFYSKFNQTKNDMVMVKLTNTPRKVNGQIVIDENGEIVYDIQNQVININRGDIPSNLRDNWFQNFSLSYSEQEGETIVIPKSAYENIYKDYTKFKDNILQYFDANGNLANEADRPTLKQNLNELFSSIGVELHSDVLDTLIDGLKGSKFKTGGNSIFHEKFGVLGTLFSPFKPDIRNAESAFGSSGLYKIANEEAKYVDSFMNTSSKDGKNRSIWAYGLNNPFTRELFDIINSARELANQREEIRQGSNEEEESAYILELLKNYYSNKSETLQLLSTLQGESLDVFLNNFQWQIYNVTKSSVKGSKGKELKQMNEREFLNSQIQLFTNSSFSSKINGKDRKWSYKFLTTPSDKTTMFVLNTPDHKISLTQDLTQVKQETIDVFYDKFLGEYNKIKAYLEGTPEYKESIDAIETYEPKIFYYFGQFNVKSRLLWNNGNLRNLDEIVDGVKVSTYVKDKIKLQIEEDIAQTKRDWTKYGLIENNKLVTGFNQNYLNSLPRSVTNIGILETLQKQIENNPLLQAQYAALSLEADIKTTNYLVADFAINKHLHNIEMSMLALGDPAMFLKSSGSKITQEQFQDTSLDLPFWSNYLNKIRDNLSKRMAGLQGSGTEPVWNTPTANTIVIRDPKTPSKILSELNKLNSRLAKKYEEIDSLDGQEFVTAQEDLALKLAQGKITKAQYNTLLSKVEGASKDIEETGQVSEKNLFTDEENFVAQAHKPLVWALINNPFLKIRKVTYNKPSAFGLYPQFTQGLEIDKLRKSIYNHNKSNLRIDRMVMLSAAKLGATAPIDNVFNTDLSLNEEALANISPSQIDQVPRQYFRIQLEVPVKKSEEIRIATQSVKLMFTEVLDTVFNTSSLNLPEKSLTGQQLKDYHDSIYQQTFGLNYRNFLIDTGATITPTNDFYYEDYTKLQQTLYDHAIQQGYDINELDGLQLNEDKSSFKLPLAFSAKSDKYEKLLLSLINDIILQKIHGRSFVLATEVGFTPAKKEIKEGTEAKDWINYNSTNIVFSESYNPELGLLPQRPDPNNEGKTLPAQVMVSFKFFDNSQKALKLPDFTYKKDGHIFLNTKKISPELLKIIGIRIPTQGHASMADIEIVGFILSFMGDLIIAPQDFTKQMGSDFDIDKLYSYMYNYQYSDNKLSRFNYTAEDEQRDRYFFEKSKKPTDKLISAIFGTETSEINKFEKQVNEKKIKILHNTMQDIYHVVLSNIAVYEKMLEGITEGNLTTLANTVGQANKPEDTSIPSMGSDRYKTTEYFENSAGKLGVGIYSANSTFLSLIEGKGISLQKQVQVERTNKESKAYITRETVPFPFIIKDNKGKPYRLLELSSGKGFNRLVSMFQSASVDNAKLKILSLLNIDKNTMGITAIMAALANDNIKQDGVPVYNEDYIIKFISQPAIIEYLTGLKKGSDDVKRNPNKFWKQDLMQALQAKYVEQLQALGVNLIENEGYSEKQLDFGIQESILVTGKFPAEYAQMQLHILQQFEYFEKASNFLRELQSLSNTDSKGTPQTIQEALYKQQRLSSILELSGTKKDPYYLGGVSNIFNGLTDYLFRMGVNLSIKAYKGNTFNAPILPYGTVQYDSFIKDFKTLQNQSQEDSFFNSQESANLWNSFLSYIWSSQELNIADKPLSNERELLIRDTETNKSLATEIEEFKNSSLFIENPSLKPLFNSLQRKINKKEPSLSFIDFNISVGIVSPDIEVITSLGHLRQINYPLFERLIKYTLLVTPANSPTSLRKFIPNFYLDAIGVSEKLSLINKQLNTEVKTANLATFDKQPEVSPLHFQLFQHYPNYATNIPSDFKGFNTNKSSLAIPFSNDNYQYFPNGYPLQFISTYDPSSKKWRLYNSSEILKETENTPKTAIWTEIPTLGDYNLSEFDASYTSKQAKPSLITRNNPSWYKFDEESALEKPLEDSNLAETKVRNAEGQNVGHLEANYGYHQFNDGKTNTQNILEALSVSSDNKGYKALAEILLEVAKKQNTLEGIAIKLGSFNIYTNNTITLDVTEPNSDKFNNSFQYNFLHELVHHFTISKMQDGSEISNILTRNIQGLIDELQTPENLQKAIDLLNLNTTPKKLLEKLSKLRSEQSDVESLTTYSSDLERSVLNPLINPLEFVASILNDENSQKWMNEVKSTKSKLNIKDKFVDFIKGLFNNFLRTIGYSTSSKTVLHEGINNVIQILAKAPASGLTTNTTAKLTPTQQKDTLTEIKREVVVRLEERRNLLYNQKNKIEIDDSISKTDKQALYEPLFKRINTVSKSIERLKNEFTIAVFEEEFIKARDYVKEILKNPTPSISEVMEAIAIVNTSELLLEQSKTDLLKSSLTPELNQALVNVTNGNSDLLKELTNISKTAVYGEYKDLTGRELTQKEMYENNSRSFGGLKEEFLAAEDNHNPLLQYVGELVYQMDLRTKDEITDAAIIREKGLAPFTEKFDFRDLLQERDEFDPITNVTKKIKNFKTRVKNEYYNAISSIYSNAKQIIGKNKSSYIKARLNEVQFPVDTRYLFPNEFNQDLGENKLSQASKDEYLQKLESFIRNEYSEFSDEFIKFRVQELVKQASDKIERYLEERKQSFELIAEDNAEDLANQTRLELNWLAYNSPFLLLNERYTLSTDSMSLKIQIPHSKITAKVNEDGEVKFVPWSKIDPITGETIKTRVADKYTTVKARRKDFTDKLTGFISDEYTQWENEYIQKVIPALEKGETPPPTMLGFLKYIQNTQQQYLKYLPNYLKKDIHYFQMFDVSPDWVEKMQETKVFLNLTLGAQLVWDDVVNTASIPFIASQTKKIDLITKELQDQFNPTFQRDSYNNSGIGNLKTNDVYRYFDVISRAAITYKNKAEFENGFKIAQFLYTQGALKTSDLTPYNEDKALLDWTINNKLYNAPKDSREQTDKKSVESSKKALLTKAEREKLQEFEKQLSDLILKYPDLESAPREAIIEYERIQNSISKIARQQNLGSIHDISEAFLRLKYMGWSPIGRIFDTISTAIFNNFKEAQDGRNFKKSDLLKSLGIMTASYGANYVSAITLTTAGVKAGINFIPALWGNPIDDAAVSTITTLASIGGVAAASQIVVNQTELKQKVSQLLLRMGALEHFDYLSEQDSRKTLSGALKILTPYNLVEQADIYNKGTTVIAKIVNYKLKDKNNKTRPLWDAFIINDGELEWNNEEFNPQNSYNLSFIGSTNSEWIKLRKSTERALKNVHGDMASGISTSLSRKSTAKRFLLFLKTYLTQEYNRTFSAPIYDPLTNMTSMGWARGYVNVLEKSVKGKEYEEYELAAYRQAQVMITILGGLTLAAMIATRRLKDDDKKDDWMISFLYYINRMNSNTGTTIDPDLGKYNTLSGVSPQLKYYLLTARLLFGDILKKVVLGDENLTYAQRDEMTRREMSANKLLPKNEILDVETREVYNPELDIYEEIKYYQMYDPSIDKTYPWTKSPEEYQKEVETVSRIKYHSMDLLPLTSAYKSLENTKKANNLLK